MGWFCSFLILYFLSPVSVVYAADETIKKRLSVAAVQFQPQESVKKNTDFIIEYLEKCSEQGIRVVVFQECATTGYVKSVISECTPDELAESESRIATACFREETYAIVGTPHYTDGSLYNTAVVFGPNGEELVRYAKIQLVGGDDWAEPGSRLVVFKIDDIPCSIIICHDERYPELVRLPVLAGARLVFYISSESNIKAEHKLEPYRAQISARADENDVYIVQANSPAMLSHGQSRIIGPDGNILVEASFFKDEMISAELDMSRATGATAKKSLRADLLESWWKEGIEKVTVIGN